MMEWTFENIIYVIAGVCLGIFAIRVILALIGCDTDFDADADFDLGDLISFKGVLHFLMGFSGYLSYRFHGKLYTGMHDIAWACIIGLIVMILLYFTYMLLAKLDSPQKDLDPEKLVGLKGIVDVVIDEERHIFRITVPYDINALTVTARSNKSWKPSDEVTILAFTNNFYLI